MLVLIKYFRTNKIYGGFIHLYRDVLFLSKVSLVKIYNGKFTVVKASPDITDILVNVSNRCLLSSYLNICIFQLRLIDKRPYFIDGM